MVTGFRAVPLGFNSWTSAGVLAAEVSMAGRSRLMPNSRMARAIHSGVARTLTPEMMDDPDVDETALRQSLRYIRGVNQVLGGQGALLGHLRRWSSDWATGEPVTLLDIATGSAIYRSQRSSGPVERVSICM